MLLRTLTVAAALLFTATLHADHTTYARMRVVAPSQNVDGSAYTNFGNIRFECNGQNVGEVPQSTAGEVVEILLSDAVMPTGGASCHARAVNSDGHDSAPSNVIALVCQSGGICGPLAPNAPALTVQ